VEFLYLLFLSSNSDLDKGNICTNLVSVYYQMGNTDVAIAWLDKEVDPEKISAGLRSMNRRRNTLHSSDELKMAFGFKRAWSNNHIKWKLK
jgi:hypothetical protein